MCKNTDISQLITYSCNTIVVKNFVVINISMVNYPLQIAYLFETSFIKHIQVSDCSITTLRLPFLEHSSDTRKINYIIMCVCVCVCLI